MTHVSMHPEVSATTSVDLKVYDVKTLCANTTIKLNIINKHALQQNKTSPENASLQKKPMNMEIKMLKHSQAGGIYDASPQQAIMLKMSMNNISDRK